MGNPPFVAKHLRTADQNREVELVWAGNPLSGVLDYVTCWYRLAAQYIRATQVRVAFVSTNSISQGEQVFPLWNDLQSVWGLKRHFAHRSFAWKSESRGSARVHVVIIGFSAGDISPKIIWEYPDEDGENGIGHVVGNISPYLREEGGDIAVRSISEPINARSPCCYGSKPTDNGNLIIEDVDLAKFLETNPGSLKYVRPLLCSDEYLYNLKRWCLWLVDAPASDIRKFSGIRDRVENVREFRLKSKKPSTKEDAGEPQLFAEIRQQPRPFLVVPQHTSENREYIPFGYFSPDYIVHNSCSFIPDASKFEFGILSSSLHMAWVKAISGRLESRYRYSTRLSYNTYPWPSDASEAQKRSVEKCASDLLDARTIFLDQSLADLYDPLAMPKKLRDAHRSLDKAVDRCYRPQPFDSDRQRVEYLFSLYEKLTSLFATRQSRRRT